MTKNDWLKNWKEPWLETIWIEAMICVEKEP